MLLEIIRQHIYLYIFILTTIEGPITTFISAGLAAQGLLNIKYIIIISFLGDILMDLILYTIGRLSHKINFTKRFSIFNKQKNKLSNIIIKRPFFYLLIIKFTPYIALPGLLFAGIKKMELNKYILYSFIISLIIKIIYITIGYMGSIGVKQLNIFISGRKQIILYAIIGIILFIITRKLYLYIGKKIKYKI